MKHPLHTLFKLIFQDTEYKKIYLSHPISKIRSLLFEKNVSDADKQTEPITHITKYLSDKSICFYPTTIDELRLDAAKENIAYSKRWEENIYAGECLDLLYVNPSDKSFLPYNEQEIEKINIEDADKKIQFKYLLVNFLKEVSKQVGIRDKMLVEQSDALFVSRPYLNGKISDGVKTEIEYIKKLYPSNAKKLGIIYFPKEDKDDTKVYQTKEGIPTFLSMSKVFNLLSENEDICKETIVNEFASKIIEKFDQNETLVQILQEIVKRLLELGLIHRKTNYQEKALDSQTSYMLTKHYNEFANKLKSSYDVLLLDLEESFHVFEDEYQTNEVINKFLTT